MSNPLAGYLGYDISFRSAMHSHHAYIKRIKSWQPTLNVGRWPYMWLVNGEITRNVIVWFILDGNSHDDKLVLVIRIALDILTSSK